MRPLLTPGEVMQLPPDDEVVMVAGVPPILGKKLRYYEDQNFKSRLHKPPKKIKLPSPRGHDWPFHECDLGPKLKCKSPPTEPDEGNGGKELRLTPELIEEAPVMEEEAPELDGVVLEDDFDDEAARKAALKRFQQAASLDLADDDVIGGF